MHNERQLKFCEQRNAKVIQPRPHDHNAIDRATLGVAFVNCFLSLGAADMQHHVKPVDAVNITGARNEIREMRINQQHPVRRQHMANGVRSSRCQSHGVGVRAVADPPRNFIHPAARLGIHLRIAIQRPAYCCLRKIEVLGQLLEIHERQHGTTPKRFQYFRQSEIVYCCAAV